MRIKLLAGILAFAFIGPTAQSAGSSCPPDDSGLKLPDGFCAIVFADSLGHARHLTVGPNGVVYVNTWSGEYYGTGVTRPDGFLVALKDNGSGKGTVIQRFGETPATGGKGGTGIALYKGALFAEINDRIVRYTLSPGEIVPRSKPEVVVSGLPLDGDHPMHSFAIDADGLLYVDVASASNSCQVKNRTLMSPGLKPCTELLTRGGVWRYDANKLNQKFSPAERYATGIRNAEGIAVDGSGRGVYTTQHGRDQLAENWPALYKPQQGATMPAEVLVKLEKGADFGWPECYFDPFQQKLVLAPEYGGDGGKKIGVCANKTPAAATFPAHWGPNALLIYNGTQFPQRYRHGAFIAFHGSWNRSPFPQGGYNIVYQTLNQGTAEARCEIFADGFAGAEKSPEKASHRPSGLAMSSEGDLYVSDDVAGRIYKITYRGNADANRSTSFVPCPSASAGAGTIAASGSTAAAASEDLPIAKGATSEMVALGNRVYHGQVGGATCIGCHGTEGKGTPLGPNLVDGDWLWGNGSLDAITKTIVEGVSKPKQYRNAMPPLGGAQLTHEQVAAVAAYIWGASHRNATDVISQATLPGEIHIPGANVFPESITSTADGTIFIGGVGTRSVFRVNPKESTAQPWVTLESDPRQGVFGVLADERSNTLWACIAPLSDTPNRSEPATLTAIALRTGKIKAHFALPTSAPFCNDIAVGADGSVYVTDTNNMEILRLDARASRLVVWAGGGAFGPKGGVLDGIVVLQNRVVVNALTTNKLFAVPINADGSSGTVTELKLNRAIHEPDGMRPFGSHALLMVESGGAGALSKVDINGNSGTVVTLKEGYPEGPVAVAVVGNTAYVLEGQLEVMFGHSEPKPTPKPFRATSVPVGSP